MMRSSRPVLSISGVTKRFGGLVAVDNISFDVAKHEMIGVIGPNGSGKTTMMNMISGRFSPTSGKITFKSHLLSELPAQEIARAGIGRTFQLVRLLPGLSVLENVMAGASFGARSTGPRSRSQPCRSAPTPPPVSAPRENMTTASSIAGTPKPAKEHPR